jgi:hypothetical protein
MVFMESAEYRDLGEVQKARIRGSPATKRSGNITPKKVARMLNAAYTLGVVDRLAGDNPQQ